MVCALIWLILVVFWGPILILCAIIALALVMLHYRPGHWRSLEPPAPVGAMQAPIAPEPEASPPPAFQEPAAPPAPITSPPPPTPHRYRRLWRVVRPHAVRRRILVPAPVRRHPAPRPEPPVVRPHPTAPRERESYQPFVPPRDELGADAAAAGDTSQGNRR